MTKNSNAWFLKDAQTGQYLQTQWNRLTNEFDLWLDPRRAWSPMFQTQADAQEWLYRLLSSTQNVGPAVDCEPVEENK